MCWLPPFALPSTTVNTAAAAAAAVNAAVVVIVLLAMSRSFVRFVDYLPWVSGPTCLSFSLVFAAIYVFSRKLIFRLVAAWPDSSSLAFGLCDILVRRLLLASVISVSASPAQPQGRGTWTHTLTQTQKHRETPTPTRHKLNSSNFFVCFGLFSLWSLPRLLSPSSASLGYGNLSSSACCSCSMVALFAMRSTSLLLLLLWLRLFWRLFGNSQNRTKLTD